MASTEDSPPQPAFLGQGGEMGRRMRAFDWAATPLGPAAQWPASLRTVVRLLLTTNHPAFIFWGADHVCLYNDAYSRSLGPEKHPSMLGAPGKRAWAEIWPVIGPQIEQVMAGGEATWHENQLVPIVRHGRLEPVYWTYSFGPIDDAGAPHGVGGVLVLCTETTADVQQQQALRAAGERWRALFDQAPGFMCVLTGPEHHFEFANPRYMELLGARDLMGKTVLQAVPEAQSQGFIGLLDRVYESGQAYTGSAVPLMLWDEAGSGQRLRYLDFVYQPIRDQAEQVSGILVEGSDVTERVLADTALADSEARWRTLAEQLPGGAVFVVDRDLRYVISAGEALTTAGLSGKDFIGKTLLEALGPEAAGTHEPHYRRALAGSSFELEHQAHGRHYLTRGTPLKSAAGLVYGVLAASYDITSRRAMEDRLRNASAQLDGVMAAAEVGTWVWDLRTNIIEHDRNLARMTGLQGAGQATPEEHRARIHAEDAPAVAAAVEAALAGGQFYIREYRVTDAQGAVRWLGGRGQVQRDEAGTPVLMAGLVIDISDLKAMEESLKASDRQKDEFLAILAHELRNPLAPILNAARLLGAERLASRELGWCRDVIRRQVRQMALLLDDLLDLPRIKQGRLRLALEQVSLASIVGSAVETASPLIDARSHRLRVDLPTRDVVLHADPGRIAQVLANLLNNAAKYTEAGGEIVLTARRRDGLVDISVSDTGIGLVADDHERIFTMFSQVDTAVGRAEGGLGIGLALVKGLVILHGGTVRADSAGLGRGSTFTVSLPVLPSAEPEVPRTPEPSRPARPGRRVLIADDNADAAESLALLLSLQGHTIRVARDGREAMSAYAAFKPDVALLDIGMPELNGYEVAERIRREPAGAGVLMAALTGWGRDDHKRQAMAAGFDLHFSKPIDIDALLAALDAGR